MSTAWGTALAQGTGSTMYWAFHSSNSGKLDVWSVPDGSNTAKEHVVNITNYQKTDRGDGHCAVPDGTDPCQRLNDRLQKGWRTPGEVAWLWNVAEGNGFPFPHVRIARISTSTFKLIDEPDVWNNSYAWVYGAAEANNSGAVGLTFYRIGGGEFPRARAAIVDDVNPSWGSLTMHGIVTSQFGTAKNSWGDYATVHPYGDCLNTWGGGVSSMQTSKNDGGAEQRFAWFGRERDGCPDLMIPSLSVTPASSLSGAALTVNVTTRNTGSATMPATKSAFYLSRDAVLSSDDTRIGHVSVGELGPGASEADHATPTATGRGTYYLLACADDKGIADEISDSNNCLAAPTTVTLQLSQSAAQLDIGSIGSISTPQLAHRLGDPLKIDVNVRSAAGGAANLQLRLAKTSRATGTRFDATALELPRATAATLLSRGAAAPPLRVRHRLLHRRAKAPTTLREGDYYVIACLTAGRRAAKRPPASRCLASRTPVHLRGHRR